VEFYIDELSNYAMTVKEAERKIEKGKGKKLKNRNGT